MKTINQLKKEIEKWTLQSSEDSGGRVSQVYEYKRDLLNAKLQTLQEVCEEINLKINYYNMPLKERLKLKLDFENGEAGHKIVILIKLLKEIKGEENQ